MHHRSRRGRRDHATLVAARGRRLARIAGRRAAGRGAARRSRRGSPRRAGRAELHERWTTAGIGSTETAAAAGRSREAQEDECQANGTGHGGNSTAVGGRGATGQTDRVGRADASQT
ncbi:MAG: hypothetical protein EBR28_10515 [Planctomycetia bacterium]|nr:hypothetical protein [Planctomycetia bacterium]